MGLDSAFTVLSNKIGFIQIGVLNQPGLIFANGYRSVFGLKRKRSNSNHWAARERLTGRPTKRSTPAGCLSGCPHSLVTRGWAKRMGQRGSFDLILIQRLGVIVDVGQRR